MEERFLMMFPKVYEEMWRPLNKDVEQIREIRIRLGKPIMILKGQEEYFLTAGGLTRDVDQGLIVAEEQINQYLKHFCRDSIYAYQEELKQGFISIPGGHRVGVAGQVMLSQGEVTGMKYIVSLNIRLSHQIKGVADKVMPYLYENGQLLNSLIISPPGGGKTTLLRDIVRQVSNGTKYGAGVNVSIIDERGEVAGCYQGVPQNDVGIRSDVLDGCPKENGMMMMLRSMSPQVVAVDELGGKEEEKALFKLSFCGCKVIATVHGEGIEDLKTKSGWQNILDNRLFERFVLLGRKNNCENSLSIFDENFRRLITFRDEKK